MSLQVKLNMKQFNKSIKAYEKALPESIKPALEKTGLRIIKDVVTLPPKAPILDGFLTAAFTVSVTDRSTISPLPLPKGGETGQQSKKTLDQDLIAPVDIAGMQKYEMRVGNSMKYAARLHDNPFQPGIWSERRGGVGYKFLSSKLFAYGVKYRDILASFIKQELGGKIYR